MNLRPALAAALLLALSGCVAFEQAPAAALSCDPALAGRWRTIGDGPGRDIAIDAQCRAQWPVHGGTVEVTLRSYAEGPLRYLILTPPEAEQMLGSDGAGLSALVPADSVFIAAYRIQDQRLRGWLPDADLVRESVQAGKLRGRLLKRDGESNDNATVLMQNDAQSLAALLERGPEPLFGRLDAPGSEAIKLKRIGAVK
ncbi:MAG: hypothetical protein HOQ32_06910 [Lysobacter sp.]|nr:hypothetical protein [Lysobacter sp.]